MKNNLQEIEGILDFIEKHLFDERLDLDSISAESGYSKYHLHRIFSDAVGPVKMASRL